MTTTNAGIAIPEDPGADEFSAIRSWCRTLARILQSIVARDRTGTVTFTANATTTTLNDPRIGATSQIILTPTTSNGKTAWATHYIAEGSRVRGAVTITHASNAATDQSFRYSIRGE